MTFKSDEEINQLELEQLRAYTLELSQYSKEVTEQITNSQNDLAELQSKYNKEVNDHEESIRQFTSDILAEMVSSNQSVLREIENNKQMIEGTIRGYTDSLEQNQTSIENFIANITTSIEVLTALNNDHNQNLEVKYESLIRQLVDYKKFMEQWIVDLMQKSDQYIETKYAAAEAVNDAQDIFNQMVSILGSVTAETEAMKELSSSVRDELALLSKTVTDVTGALAMPSKALIISETAENVVNVLKGIFPDKQTI